MYRMGQCTKGNGIGSRLSSMYCILCDIQKCCCNIVHAYSALSDCIVFISVVQGIIAMHIESHYQKLSVPSGIQYTRADILINMFRGGLQDRRKRG